MYVPTGPGVTIPGSISPNNDGYILPKNDNFGTVTLFVLLILIWILNIN